MKHGIVLYGSARGDGNTAEIANFLAKEKEFEIVDLNEYTIGYFSYDNENEGDGFLSLINRLNLYDHWILVTPVYWYSMSAQMKTFFDRLSDLMKWHKPIGRSLKRKKLSAVSCGSDSNVPKGFFEPFYLTAEYLDMEYMGNAHTWIENGIIPDQVKLKLAELGSRNYKK